MKLGSAKSNLSCKLLRWILKEHSTILLVPTAVQWEPISCSLPSEWLQQLFAPCFKNVCGNSCADLQQGRQSEAVAPSNLHCHRLTDTQTGAKRNSLLFLAFGPKFWRSMYKLYKRCWMKLHLQDTGVFLAFNVVAQRVFALPSFRDFQARC